MILLLCNNFPFLYNTRSLINEFAQRASGVTYLLWRRDIELVVYIWFGFEPVLRIWGFGGKTRSAEYCIKSGNSIRALNWRTISALGGFTKIWLCKKRAFPSFGKCWLPRKVMIRKAKLWNKVKSGRAGLVLGWVTIREYPVSWGPFLAGPVLVTTQGMFDAFLTPRRRFGCQGRPTELVHLGFSVSPSRTWRYWL